MACVLFSRPMHDNTINYLHYYSKELVKLSESLGHKTIDKEHKMATKEIIQSIIIKNKPNFIMFNGHGSPSVICGHNNEVIVSAERNPELLANAITYSFSCSSASILGKKSIEKGALCFIGYDMDFALGKDPDSQAVPAKDEIAKLFLEPSNLLVKSILRGSSVKNAVDKAKENMNANIWFLNTTDKFPEASHYAPFLFGNYLGLIVHGNDSFNIS